MISLFAVPFDQYKNKLTSQGIQYNIQSADGLLYAQVEVNNLKYKRHDCMVEEQPEAPNEVRQLLTKHLDTLLPDGWKVRTIFNRKETSGNPSLEVKDIKEGAKGIFYIDGKPEYAKISLNVSHGIR